MNDKYLEEGTIVYHKLNNIEIVVLARVAHSIGQQFHGRYREDDKFKSAEFYYSEVRKEKEMNELDIKFEAIRLWLNSPEGQVKLSEAYERTKKVVDELVESRIVDSETLNRPFNI